MIECTILLNNNLYYNYIYRVCLNGERISVRIALFGLVVENSARLVISRKI
jgi:hypothetical protein